MGNKDIEELFVEGGDVKMARVKGAFKKFCEEMEVNDDIVDKRQRINPDDELVPVTLQNFLNWLQRRTDGDVWEFLEEHGVLRDVEDAIAEYYDGSEHIQELVDENTLVVDEGGGVYGVYSEIDGKYVGGEDSQTHRYPELNDIGVIDDDMIVNWNVIRGTMKSYAEDVDEIVGDNTSPITETVKEEWMSWMIDKFDNEWIRFTQEQISPSKLRLKVKNYYSENKEFRDLVVDKYRQVEMPDYSDDDDDGELVQTELV